MEKEYLDRKTNSSTTKHSFGSGLLGKDDKKVKHVTSVKKTPQSAVISCFPLLSLP